MRWCTEKLHHLKQVGYPDDNRVLQTNTGAEDRAELGEGRHAQLVTNEGLKI